MLDPECGGVGSTVTILVVLPSIADCIAVADDEATIPKLATQPAILCSVIQAGRNAVDRVVCNSAPSPLADTDAVVFPRE